MVYAIKPDHLTRFMSRPLTSLKSPISPIWLGGYDFILEPSQRESDNPIYQKDISMNNKIFFATVLITAIAILVSVVIIFPTGLSFFGYKEFRENSKVGVEQLAIPTVQPLSSTATVVPNAQPPSSTETAVTFGSSDSRRAAGSSQRSERQ